MGRELESSKSVHFASARRPAWLTEHAHTQTHACTARRHADRQHVKSVDTAKHPTYHLSRPDKGGLQTTRFHSPCALNSTPAPLLSNTVCPQLTQATTTIEREKETAQSYTP